MPELRWHTVVLLPVTATLRWPWMLAGLAFIALLAAAYLYYRRRRASLAAAVEPRSFEITSRPLFSDEPQVYDDIVERQRVAQMSDSELAAYGRESSMFEVLFQPGRHKAFFGPNAFAVELDDPEQPGRMALIPDLPVEVRFAARVLAEEQLIRELARISDGVLADMMLFADHYRELWDSFGEFAVWESQYRDRQTRGQYRRGQKKHEDEPFHLDPTAVHEFQQAFVNDVQLGRTPPLDAAQIASGGIAFVGRRFDCNDSFSVNDLLVRVRSPIRFLTNSYLPDQTRPFQFSLACCKLMSIDDPETKRPMNALLAEQTLVQSPTLAPDMMGWTPR